MDIELPHGSDKSFDAVQYVFVDGEAVEPEFLRGVAILMDNLHLLHDRGFAAFSGSCGYEISMYDCR